MIKLMIADDEAGIRRGLRQYVDWGLWDIQLVAEAENGAEAYRLALETRPDILLSDIRMPQRDGISLIRDLKDLLPALRVILLTGYSDTDYLQSALRYGVKDYLLKPAGADTIIDSVLKVKREILHERDSRREDERKSALLSEGLPVLQMCFMSDLIRGRLPSEAAARKKAQLLHLPLDFPYVQAALLRQGESESADYRSDQENAMDFWQLTQLVALAVGRRDHCFFTEWEPDRLLLVAGGNSAGEVDAVLKDLCGELVRAISPQRYPSLAAGVGRPARSLLELSASWAQAAYALNLSAWDRESRLFFAPDGDGNTSESAFRDWEAPLLKACLEGDWEEMRSLLCPFFAECARTGADFERVKSLCEKLLSLSDGLRPDGQSGEPSPDTARIAACLSADELSAWVFDRLPPSTGRRGGDACSALVLEAQQYVRTHYAESITLQKLATDIFVSPNYLGRIFREQTGYKFGDWLNRYRVEQAKRLLSETPAKTYEVASMVGFSSYKYFSVCFLKYAHCSASEYRAHGRYSRNNIGSV